MSREVFVHAGAHRTGTSSFQLCLAANRSALGEAGYDVAYPGRDGVPGGELSMRLPRPRHKDDEHPVFVDKVKKTLSKHVTSESRSLILSEENLAGIINHFFKGRLYPNRKKRLEVFRSALEAIDGRVAHVVFVIRPYEDLFISGFRKRAEDNPVSPFAEYAEQMSRFSGGWPETVQSLRNVLGPDRLTVVEYGQRGRSRDLLSLLLDDEASRFAEPDHDLNTSATDAALEYLQAQYHSGKELSRPEWQEVIRDFSESNEDRGFTRFSSAQKERLDARYTEDLNRLAGRNDIALII